MKMWQRTLSALMVLAMIACMLPGGVLRAAAESDELPIIEEVEIEEVPVQEQSAPVQEPDAEELTEEAGSAFSGSCGDPSENGGQNVTWQLEDDGVLTISGSGRMMDVGSSTAPWYAYRGSISFIIIENGITHIGSGLFRNCSNAVEVSIADSVESIGAYAFQNCSGLSEIRLPSKLRTAGEGIFAGCSGIGHLYIPGTLSGIPARMMQGCTDLFYVQIYSGPLTIGDSAFDGCSSLHVLYLPSTLTSIGTRSFADCTSLENVSLPSRLSILGDGAFAGCSKLSNLTLPNQLKLIGAQTFAGCSSLLYVTIPGSVTGIGSYAFQYCTLAETFRFLGDAPSIGEGAFTGVTATMLYPTGTNGWDAVSGQNYGGNLSWHHNDAPVLSGYCGVASVNGGRDVRWAISSDGTLTISGTGRMESFYENGYSIPWALEASRIKALVVENGVANVGSTSMSGLSNLTSISLPASVTEIEFYAFSGTGIETLELPATVAVIGEGAFSSCGSLREVTLHDGLTSIGNAAFYGCGLLSEVTIPGTVTTLGSSIFENCSNLSRVTLSEGIQQVGERMFCDCTMLSSISLPSTLKRIRSTAFANCCSLNAISIPNGVWDISNAAFSNCTALTSITLPETVVSLESDVFSGCTGLVTVNLPQSLRTIYHRAFMGCTGLRTLTIPKDVIEINGQAFAYCTNLRTINFEGSAPGLSPDTFEGITVTCRYPRNDTSWNTAITQHYDGRVTWVAYTPVPTVTQTGVTLTNNQSILVTYSAALSGTVDAAHFEVTGALGEPVTVTYAALDSGTTYKLNFSDPLKVGTYTVRFLGVPEVSGTFEITLDLSVYRIVDSRHVIIQLSDAIMGCTDAPNYSFHALGGETINITEAVSAFAELGGVAPNVFKLTTDMPLVSGTTYVVETKGMSKDGVPCQGTIAYFTVTGFESGSTVNVSVTALTNNQSIKIFLPKAVSGADVAANYVIKNSKGQTMPVGNVQVKGENRYEINFADPLKADHYTISSVNMDSTLTGSFDITLDLRIVRIEENSVIIQLNEPIYGCTDAPNYFVHKLGMSKEITAVKAESVFAELGGELPNVFRITLPEHIVIGQTYIIETRAMSLDPNWEHPCQGTIAYFTK